MVSYPCPFCGAPAGLESGCSGCGRPPYPDAAEVVRLNERTIELHAEVQSARTHLAAAVQRYNAVQSQRNMLAARVKAAVTAAAPRRAAAGSETSPVEPNFMKFPARPAADGANAAGLTAAGPGSATAGPGSATAGAGPSNAGPRPAAGTAPSNAGPGPAAAGPGPSNAGPGPEMILGQRPEAAPRTVQNLLFILGGLLLGSAAIVFTAVAWASFGVLGRAAILAVVTLLTLAVPPIALARRLRATGETFAALGVLLVLLDGYAAWYVNLAGLAEATTPTAYAGLAFAVTAAVAGGYALLTRLTAPRLAAVVAVQPVLPLLALHRGLGPIGWTLVLVGVAAIGVLLGRTVEKLAWIPAGLAALSALPPALHALATVDGVPEAARAGGAMVLLAALVAVAALTHPATAPVGAGVATVLVALAAARLVAEALPGQRYVAFAALALLLVAAAIVAPQKVRRGTRIGALVVASGFAAPYVYFAVLAAVQTVALALPAWRPESAPRGDVLPYRLFDWQEPAGLVLLAAALWLLLRHRAVPWTAIALVAFAAPAALPSPTALAASVADIAALLALVAIALRYDRPAAVAMPFVAAHLALTGLATPGATLVVYAVLGGLSTVVAARAAERRLSLPAAVVALLCLPVAAAAAFRLLRLGTAGSGPVPPALLGATAGLAALTAAALILRNRAHNAGTIATATAGAGVSIAATLQSATTGGATWFGTYAVAALACTWYAARAFRPPATAPAHRRTSAPVRDDPGPTGTPEATGPAAVSETARPDDTPDPARPSNAGGADETARPAAVSAATAAHAAPAIVPLLLAAAALLPAVSEALLRPLAWLGAIWRGAPAGVGLGPRGTEWWADTPSAFGPAAAAITLAALAGLGVEIARRTGAARWPLAAPPASLAAILGCVAIGAPWPVVPAVTLAAGLATALAAALRRPSPGAAMGALACWPGIAAGLAGCLATPAATLSALGAIVAAAVFAGLAGRSVPARALAWPAAAASAAWLAFAAARAADLPLRAAAYWVLLAAALALGAGWLLRDRRLPVSPPAAQAPAAPVPVTLSPALAAAFPTAPTAPGPIAPSSTAPTAPTAPGPIAPSSTAPAPGPAAAFPTAPTGGAPAPVAARSVVNAPLPRAGLEGRLLDAVAHAVAVVAVLLTVGNAAAAAGVVGLWGVALGLRALSGRARLPYTAAAIAAELLAYELVLVAGRVDLAEAYTVPVAAVAVGAGWFAARRNPRVSSWTAFGPGLLAGFVPSLGLVFATAGEPGRRLLLGAAAVAVVLAGARLRLKAPIAAAGAVLAMLAWHEISVFWDYLPRWAPLAIGGALLVGFAVTYERRLRDLARLRAAVGRMR